MSDNKNFSIELDDGKVKVPINNKYGEEIGVFYFRPTDINILERYKKVADEFGEILKPLENFNLETDGTSNDVGGMEALNQARTKLFELCNYLFDGDMAEAFFGKMNPFSPVDGKFYCENVLNAVGNFISNQFKTETEQLNARVSKYTHGVKTGKHKNGAK